MDQTSPSSAEPLAPTTESSSTAATATATLESPEKVEKADKAAKARFKVSYDRFVQRLAGELKEAGKIGKKQWEDALKSTRVFVQRARPELKREDLEKVVDTVKADVVKTMRSVKARSQGWTKSDAFLSARDKGAEVLLGLATRLKGTFETIESNLEETLKDRAVAQQEAKKTA